MTSKTCRFRFGFYDNSSPRSRAPRRRSRSFLGRFCLWVICVVYFVILGILYTHTPRTAAYMQEISYIHVCFGFRPLADFSPAQQLDCDDRTTLGPGCEIVNNRCRCWKRLRRCRSTTQHQHWSYRNMEVWEARKTAAASGGDSPTLFVLSRFVAGVPTESQHGHQAGVRVRRFDIQPGAITKVSGFEWAR